MRREKKREERNQRERERENEERKFARVEYIYQFLTKSN